MGKSCDGATRDELKRIVLRQREVLQRLLQAAACLADEKVCFDSRLFITTILLMYFIMPARAQHSKKFVQ